MNPTTHIGVRVRESWHAPRDQVLRLRGTLLVHPSNMMVLRLGYRPFYSRYAVGIREADRDRRRRAKG